MMKILLDLSGDAAVWSAAQMASNVEEMKPASHGVEHLAHEEVGAILDRTQMMVPGRMQLMGLGQARMASGQVRRERGLAPGQVQKYCLKLAIRTNLSDKTCRRTRPQLLAPQHASSTHQCGPGESAPSQPAPGAVRPDAI
jgi:hypothetical protein